MAIYDVGTQSWNNVSFACTEDENIDDINTWNGAEIPDGSILEVYTADRTKLVKVYKMLGGKWSEFNANLLQIIGQLVDANEDNKVAIATQSEALVLALSEIASIAQSIRGIVSFLDAAGRTRVAIESGSISNVSNLVSFGGLAPISVVYSATNSAAQNLRKHIELT